MKMRQLLILLSIATSLLTRTLAAPPSDAEASKLLTGKWVAEKEGPVVAATINRKPDGTFTSSATFLTEQGEVTVDVEGKWRVEKGVQIQELTRSSKPSMVPVGSVSRDVLLSVTQNEYRYRSQNGKEHTCRRFDDIAKPKSKK